MGLHHFHLVNNTELLDRMNRQCHIIYVHGNIYYAHMLLGPQFGKYSAYVRKYFKSPFYDISRIVFRPKDYLMKRVLGVKDIFKTRAKYSSGKKGMWLSIHMRGIMTKWPERAFECANALLDGGNITGVFLATDSAPLQDMAYKMIRGSSHTLYTIKKNLENTIDLDTDSMDIRNTTRDIRIAVLEWYLIGEANYCLSTSLDQSTFSKTAVARGDCVLVDARLGAKCFIPPPGTDNDKEWLLHMKVGNRHKRYEWMQLPRLGTETIWSTVETGKEKVTSQCLPTSAQRNNVILDYWRSEPTSHILA